MADMGLFQYRVFVVFFHKYVVLTTRFRHKTSDTPAHVSVKNTKVPVIIQKSMFVCEYATGSNADGTTTGSGTARRSALLPTADIPPCGFFF